MKWVSKWLRRSPAERRLIVHVALLLGMVRLALKLFPLQTLCRTLDWISLHCPASSASDDNYPQQVAWTTSIVGKHLFAVRPCLAQALVVQLLYKRRGIPANLHIGVAKREQGRLEAHAWIESNGMV